MTSDFSDTWLEYNRVHKYSNWETIMPRICAWCGKCLGYKDGQGLEGETHGICDDCSETELNKIKEN